MIRDDGLEKREGGKWPGHDGDERTRDHPVGPAEFGKQASFTSCQMRNIVPNPC